MGLGAGNLGSGTLGISLLAMLAPEGEGAGVELRDAFWDIEGLLAEDGLGAWGEAAGWAEGIRGGFGF